MEMSKEENHVLKCMSVPDSVNGDIYLEQRRDYSKIVQYNSLEGHTCDIYILNKNISHVIDFFEGTEKQGDKEKLYSYYHKVVLRQHAVRAFRNAGYVMEDEVNIDYRLRSMFAKLYLKKPDGTFDIALEDKKRMGKDRLLNFIVDVIHFLETELGEMVSDSEEYKIWKQTGKKLSKIR